MRGVVVLAAHDDDRAVGPVLAEIAEAARALAPSDIQLAVVLADAASTDATVDVATATAAQLELAVTVVAAGDVSPDQAYRAGIGHAVDHHLGDFVVTLDADGQHDGRQIPDLVRAFLARGSGMTIGSRWLRGGSSPGTGPARAALSRVANIAARTITGVRRVSDTTTAFRVMTLAVADLVRTEGKDIVGPGYFSAAVAITQAHGFSVSEVPITFRPRYSGLSRVERRDVPDFARNVLAARHLVGETRATMRSNQALWASRSSTFRNQHSSSERDFAAIDELSNLTQARRFNAWVAEQIEPYLGRRVVEVGAGLGAIARLTAEADAQRMVVALEPAENLFPTLCENVADLPNVQPRRALSGELLAGEAGTFDAAVYVSVLEHILDDVAELQIADELVRPGGYVVVFVPAMPSLYGTLDFKSGHYRRYDRAALRSVAEAAGLDVVDLRYLDVAGVVPYWGMYRLLKRDRLDSASSGIFDSVIVPASKLAQRIVPDPPFGKNLLLIAQRR